MNRRIIVKEKRLVLNVNWYSFNDKESNKTVEGVKITSISIDNSDIPEGINAKGFMLLEDKSRDLSVLNSFKTVPVIYDFEYGIAVKKGKVELEFKDAILDKEVDLSSIFSTKKIEKFPTAVGK